MNSQIIDICSICGESPPPHQTMYRLRGENETKICAGCYKHLKELRLVRPVNIERELNKLFLEIFDSETRSGISREYSQDDGMDL
jgi:hypothetical protein